MVRIASVGTFKRYSSNEPSVIFDGSPLVFRFLSVDSE